MKKLLVLLSICSLLIADELTDDPPLIWETSCSHCFDPCFQECYEECITADLNNPTYEGGILETKEGGVLRGQGLFLQAREIRYDKEKNQIYAEGDILAHYFGQVLIGKSFYYDFKTHSGHIVEGQTSYPPWQIHAKEIKLNPDGSLALIDGCVSVSEGPCPDLAVTANCFKIDCERRLSGSKAKITLWNQPVLPLPFVTLDLTNLKRSRFAVKLGWGGYLGPAATLRYHALSYRSFKASLRVDGFLKHGLGAGIETDMDPKCSPLAFFTRNYWAHDLALDDPTKRNRYRFQGSYYDLFYNNKTSVRARYDYVSDAQMAADYNHDSFNLNPAQETKLLINHKENSFIANLLVDVRVNSFQTVDQRLPSLEWNMHPVRLPYTSCLFENYLQVGYISFITSDKIFNERRQKGARLEARPAFYWPLHFSNITLTPLARLIAIGYSNSPEKHTQNQILGEFSVEATSSLYNCYNWGLHTVQPHMKMTHLTNPSSSLHEHFIFTIEDGYTRFNALRFGVKNFLTLPFSCRPLTVDLWANAFFAPKNGIQMLPKSYLDVDWQLLPTLYWQMGLGFHYKKELLDFFNTRLEWSLSENAALRVEYRKRGAFAWRKNDYTNFILDIARNEEELLASSISDKRQTLLTSLFYRITPDLTAKFSSRFGRHAEDDRSYFEYEIESSAMILDHIWLNFTFQKKEADVRFAFALSLKP